MPTIEQAQSYLARALELIEQGKYTEAIEPLDQAIPIFEVLEEWEYYAFCLNKYSECLWQNGQYDAGLEEAKKALQFCLDRWGEENLSTAMNYNNLGICYQQKGNYEQATVYYKKALAIRLEIIGEGHLSTASSYNNLGMCFDDKGDYTQAIAYHQQALTILLATLGEQHMNTAMSYNNLGMCYNDKCNYTQAMTYYRKALTIRLATIGQKHPYTAMSYNDIGSCYDEQGDYVQAIAYYQQALAIRLATIGEQHSYTAMTCSNLGGCYKRKGDYTQAIFYLQRALSIWLATVGEQHPYTAANYNNLGNYYKEKNDYANAINYYQKALAIWLATVGEQHLNIAIGYNNLADYSRYKFDYDKSITYYQQSLVIKLATLGKKHPSTAQTYRNFAQTYHLQSQYPQALQYLQLSLQSLALDVPEEDYYPLPKLEGYNSAVELLEVLPAKAATLAALYHQSQTPQDLVATLAHYQAADQLIDQMRQSYKTEGSKLVLAEKGKTKVYDEGLYTAFEAQQFIENNQQQMNLSQFNPTLGYQLPERPIDLAFHFSEKSKAVLLLAGIKDAEARLNAQLPPDLAQQEYDLRVELTYLERRINEEGYKKDEEQDKTALNEWQSQHFDFKNQYDALIERLETEYPKYYQLKYDIQAATIAQIQAKLSPQKAMISYVLSEKYLYTFILTTTHSQWLQTELPADFAGLIEDFLLSFQSISKRDYITYGHDLYRHLILPALNTGALNHIQQLIIIPDGLLSRIPFEALLSNDCSDNTPYQNLPYLLHQFQISYHYSATLWLNQQTAAPNPQKQPDIGDFIGFAPIYSDTAQNTPEYDIDLTLPDDFYEKIGIEKPQEQHRLSYAPNTDTAEVLRSVIDGRNFITLLHSETEVRKAAELFGAKGQSAKLLLHQKATLDNFKALAGKYRYILVSAHADYNDQKPDQTGIIFSPNESNSDAIFYMGDAYNLSLQADLVVLSCCETGLGNVQKGEGTMALNRGFLYSGAKNVIYTLFKVYDKASSELTAELFRALLSDLMPIAALRQAKLHLIKRGLMPNKWAGYVLVGE